MQEGGIEPGGDIFSLGRQAPLEEGIEGVTFDDAKIVCEVNIERDTHE